MGKEISLERFVHEVALEYAGEFGIRIPTWDKCPEKNKKHYAKVVPLIVAEVLRRHRHDIHTPPTEG